MTFTQETGIQSFPEPNHMGFVKTHTDLVHQDKSLFVSVSDDLEQRRMKRILIVWFIGSEKLITNTGLGCAAEVEIISMTMCVFCWFSTLMDVN